MDYAKKYRWVLGGFVVMVLLNIGLMVTIWMILPPPELPGLGMAGDSQPGVQRFLQRELNLDRQQMQQLRDLRQQHFTAVRPVMKQIRDNRARALELVNSADMKTGQQELDSLTAQVGRLHSEIERHNYRHFQQIRMQLNEDQQQQFDVVIRQTLDRPRRMMRSGAGGQN